MNKTAIKNYAVWARKDLIDRVKRKAYEYEVTDSNLLDGTLDIVHGKPLNKDEKKQRQDLIHDVKEKGFDHVMEEVAYTWFNRFIALRFMEVNNYLPKRIRIFTNENNEFKPQIIDEAMNIELEGLDKNEVYELLQSNNQSELYKKLLIAICNDMGNYLPGMFKKINDYRVLLFPDNLLNPGSVLDRMISDIDEDSWLDSNIENESSNGITIIGWLYQYYISEKHDQVINILKGTIKKEDIPAATQLWTTDWVVRYMVDNSLGRYWVERNPESSLREKLVYLATSKNNDLPIINESVNPEEITFLDPCMGSGHILVYAFDVFMEIYKECGYSERDAAVSIVQNNLYGLDIDDRAYQLAYFAVMMKARSYNRRILTQNIWNNLSPIEETNDIKSFEHKGLTYDLKMNEIGNYLADAFKDAKEIGSLLKIKKSDYKQFVEYLQNIQENGTNDIFAFSWMEEVLPKMLQITKQASILSNKYTVVTTNPPYMGKMEGNLKQFVTENYKDFSSDIFAVFMRRNFDFAKQNGYLGFMTPFVWMFIKSYERLRQYIIHNKGISTLVQMEYSAYEEATVPICSFVLRNEKQDKPGYYYRLSDFKGGMEVQRQKVIEAQSNKECGYFYEAIESNFSKIPGSPIAYWSSEKALSYFENELAQKYISPRIGLVTGDTDRFLKFWFEVCNDRIFYHCISNREAINSKMKWFPYQKGGAFRKWYGNNEYILNWENDGWECKNDNFSGKRVKSHNYNGDYAFKKAITWTKISSGSFSCRYVPNGFMFDDAGPICTVSEQNINVFLGLLNSKIVAYYLNILSPTMNYLPGHIKAIPVFYAKMKADEGCSKIVENNIMISKCDWDSFETSWDFQRHPLVALAIKTTYKTNGVTSYKIEDAFFWWNDECDTRFAQLKANEEELNRIFIDIYGLQDELTPEIEDKDVTVRKADLVREVKSLISYAVGCMFGRYSLDEDGLAYAGGEWDSNKYKTYIPDKDNIIPISDDEYFEEDIVGRFIDFIKVVYGEDTLEENLEFIASALSGTGTSREIIRNYFLNEFYKDHCKMYQKRPIYWMFDSGKRNGFKALIYMHRYSSDLIARLRTQYVFEQQSRYRNQIEMMQSQLDGELSSSERVKLNKKLKSLREQDEELRCYEEKVHHFADFKREKLEIDLDDGVKVNYDKFNELLAKIK